MPRNGFRADRPPFLDQFGYRFRLRFHTVTSKPAPSRFRAMGRPIAPKPTTETEVMDFPLESAEPSKTVQDSHTGTVAVEPVEMVRHEGGRK